MKVITWRIIFAWGNSFLFFSSSLILDFKSVSSLEFYDPRISDYWNNSLLVIVNPFYKLFYVLRAIESVSSNVILPSFANNFAASLSASFCASLWSLSFLNFFLFSCRSLVSLSSFSFCILLYSILLCASHFKTEENWSSMVPGIRSYAFSIFDFCLFYPKSSVLISSPLCTIDISGEASSLWIKDVWIY